MFVRLCLIFVGFILFGVFLNVLMVPLVLFFGGLVPFEGLVFASGIVSALGTIRLMSAGFRTVSETERKDQERRDEKVAAEKAAEQAVEAEKLQPELEAMRDRYKNSLVGRWGACPGPLNGVVRESWTISPDHKAVCMSHDAQGYPMDEMRYEWQQQDSGRIGLLLMAFAEYDQEGQATVSEDFSAEEPEWSWHNYRFEIAEQDGHACVRLLGLSMEPLEFLGSDTV